MASVMHYFLLSIVTLSFYNAAASSISLPIKKDTKTLQYYTSLAMGTPQYPIKAVIDLGGTVLWFNCDSGFNSSSYKIVPCWSNTCEISKLGAGCGDCFGPVRPGCTKQTCSPGYFNPYIGRLTGNGLYEDILSLPSTRVSNFPFGCVDKEQIGGLASGAEGMLGLNRNPLAISQQISSASKISHKFALCLPSGSGIGKLVLGSSTQDVAKLLASTPLIINPVGTGPIRIEGEPSEEYFMDVKSIKVSGKVVSFKPSLLNIDSKGVGGTKFSTLTNYTTLHTSIYRAIVNAFVNEAASMKISRVAAVAPFRACFNSKTIKSSKTGPVVPEIELVVQGQGVSWKIYGANSMVKVNQNVMCLAFLDGGSTPFLDGGSSPRTSIIIGAHQMEDNYVEFDLASSKIGFSSSLLLHGSSCSGH